MPPPRPKDFTAAVSVLDAEFEPMGQMVRHGLPPWSPRSSAARPGCRHEQPSCWASAASPPLPPETYNQRFRAGTTCPAHKCVKAIVSGHFENLQSCTASSITGIAPSVHRNERLMAYRRPSYREIVLGLRRAELCLRAGPATRTFRPPSPPASSVR